MNGADAGCHWVIFRLFKSPTPRIKKLTDIRIFTVDPASGTDYSRHFKAPGRISSAQPLHEARCNSKTGGVIKDSNMDEILTMRTLARVGHDREVPFALLSGPILSEPALSLVFSQLN